MIADLKSYPEYKASGLPWLGQVPSHWEISPFSGVARLKSVVNQTHRELLSVYLQRGVVKFSDVDEKRTNGTSEDLSRYQAVDPGDFVLNNQQAWRGSVGVSAFSGIVSPAYLVLSLTRRYLPQYANFLFRDQYMVSQYLICSKGVGTIQRNLYWPLLKRVGVPLPPPSEQAAIVRFLDWANGRLERAIRAKRKVIALLHEQKQAIIHKAVTQGLDPNVPKRDSGIPWLGEIPEHWETPLNRQLFRENVRQHNGKTERQLSLSQRDGLIATDDMKERSLQTSSFDNWKVTVPGDLVLNRFKAHLGVFFASTLRGIVSFHYGVFEPQRKLNTKYFELLCHTAPYKVIYAGRSNGMTVGLQNLSNQNFYGVRSIVPPLLCE